MKFTIFTGCYNSSNYIERVFKSLKSQTYTDFEWIVIDDASKDNTVDILNRFKTDNPEFDIKIISLKKNMGVSENRRYAIKIAKGDFFITWDHDDVQLPNQLLRFKEIWEKLGNNLVANIFAFCQDKNGNILGKLFPKGNHISNYFDYYKEYFMSNVLIQEKHVCSRTDVLNMFIDYKFPEGLKLNGELFWAKIALEYNSIFLNESLRSYYIEESNQNNMSNKTRSQMAEDVYLQKTVWVNHLLKGLGHEPMLVLRLIFAQTFYGFLSKKKFSKIIEDNKNVLNKIIVLFMTIPVKILLLKMKITGKGL